VGAVILARRRSGLDEAHELSVGELMRGRDAEERGAGTDTEAGLGTIEEAAGRARR
jgi:hypothetical protein